jgi:hypothetical protein
MMRAGEWIRGESADALATTWELDPCTVRRDAAEASRVVTQDMSDEDYAEHCRQKLDEIGEAAMEFKQAGAAVSAVKVQMESRGILQRNKRLDRGGPNLPEGMSPAQAANQLLSWMLGDPELRAIVRERVRGEFDDDGHETKRLPAHVPLHPTRGD